MSQKSSTIAQKSSLEFSSKVTVNSFNDYHDFFSYTYVKNEIRNNINILVQNKCQISSITTTNQWIYVL